VPIWALVLGPLSVSFVYVSLLAIDFTQAFASSGSNPCKQLYRLLRRRSSCLSLCRLVLGGRFEGE